MVFISRGAVGGATGGLGGFAGAGELLPFDFTPEEGCDDLAPLLLFYDLLTSSQFSLRSGNASVSPPGCFAQSLCSQR